VFLLGADELGVRVEDRASFYVGATRAKLHLIVSGMKRPAPTLLDEIVETARAFDPASVTNVPPPPPKPRPAVAASDEKVVARPTFVATGAPSSPTPASKGRCRHCGSERLHAQSGQFGYFFRCIDCTQNTPMDATCPACQKKGRIRKAMSVFFRECEGCGHSAVLHTNVPLSSL
jgi:hypothetical protein